MKANLIDIPHLCRVPIWLPILGYPRALPLLPHTQSASGKETSCQCRRNEFHPWVRKIPWRRKWQPSAVFLPGESHGQRNLAGYSPQGLKESDTTEATEHVCTHKLENPNIQHGMGPTSSGWDTFVEEGRREMGNTKRISSWISLLYSEFKKHINMMLYQNSKCSYWYLKACNK